jgi:type VI secretion system protein VasG
MRVDPKSLVRRLTPTATSALEIAVGRAATTQTYEILPEHLLSVLLERDDGDAALLLGHFEKNRVQLAARVERVLQRLRGGNGGRPVLSQALFSWLRDAWLVASVERGAALVRSADLIATFAEYTDRYSAESFPELEELPHAEVRAQLASIVGKSPESGEAEPAQTSQPGGALSPQTPGREGALQRFTTSFTQLARDGKIDPVLGRHREIRQLIDVLSRRRKNNPILVGEPGVGKTALVEGLARAIVAGEVPESLREVELVGLDLGALQAGSGVRGEFEQRLKSVINEVKGSPVPVILFIDEAHTLIGAGGAQGTGDAANLLKPELARGELRTIAATTWSEYKKYFEKDAALERRFQPVKVEEPTEEEALTILRGLKETYEKAHGIVIRDEALVASARLSARYVSGRQLPDKAVDLLDSAAARTKTEVRAKPEVLVALESDLAGARRARASLERDKRDGVPFDQEALAREAAAVHSLEDRVATLQARWEAERAAVDALLGARKALASAAPDSPLEPLQRNLHKAGEALGALQAGAPLIHTEADAQAVARMVQSWTGIPVGNLQSDSIRAVLELEERLGGRIKGQQPAIQVLSEAVRMSAAGVANPDAPRAVLLFVGTSGVGKTETALALADAVFGGERFLTSIAMSEFQEKHSVSRLIGSPPGYVGYGEGGVLTEAVRRHPYSVVLLDECEKADLEVMNLFYQVFDKGTLNDGEGRRIDFRNTIVILTSNLATDVIAKLHEGGAQPTPEAVADAIRPTLSRHFKPALLARMTVVPFAPMSPEILAEIVTLKLARVRERVLSAHGAETVFAPELVAELTRRCTESESGARNIDHVLRSSLLPALSREVLARMADESRFKSVHVSLKNGQFDVQLA